MLKKVRQAVERYQTRRQYRKFYDQMIEIAAYHYDNPEIRKKAIQFAAWYYNQM